MTPNSAPQHIDPRPPATLAVAPAPFVAPELWSEEQVSEYTGVPLGTIRDWRSARHKDRDLIPYIKVGGRFIRYRPERVVAWLAEQEIG